MVKPLFNLNRKPAQDYIHVHSFSILILQGQRKLLHAYWTSLVGDLDDIPKARAEEHCVLP